MAKKEKLLKKIQQGIHNVRPQQLTLLMKKYGFETDFTGENFIFTHKELNTRVVIANPHGREKKVLVRYVKRCLESIEELKLKRVEYED